MVVKKSEKDLAPSFIDIHDRTLRNNFGLPGQKHDASLPRFVEPAVSHSQKIIIPKFDTTKSYTPRSYTPMIKSPKISWIWILGVILVIILALLLVLYLIPYLSTETPVENGECSIWINTYVDGSRVRQSVPLGGKCHVADDCRDMLLQQHFSQKDVNRMAIACQERQDNR